MAILIIRGISVSEIINTVVRAPIKEQENTYCEIPRRFVGVEAWPKFTNLLCHVCHRVPVSYPKFLPKDPAVVRGRDECDVVGNFCEWTCVATYIEQEFPVARWWDLKETTLLFARQFPDAAALKSLPSGPSFRRMKIYAGNGGTTNEQHQEAIDRLLREVGGDRLGLTI